MIRSEEATGRHHVRKSYLVLQGNQLKSFKTTPESTHEEDPIRSASIDFCIKVTDEGVENIQTNVFYVFTIESISNHNDYLKMGVTSDHDAEKWIQALMDLALKVETAKQNAEEESDDMILQGFFDDAPELYMELHPYTLPNDPTRSLKCSWSESYASMFNVRGKTYLVDTSKIKAQTSYMKLIAVEWIRSEKGEDHLGGRQGSIVQQSAANGGNNFFFIVNMKSLISGTTYNLAFYYVRSILEEDAPPLFEDLQSGNECSLTSRFKGIIKKEWSAKFVGPMYSTTIVLFDKHSTITHFHGENYHEIEIIPKSMFDPISWLCGKVVHVAFLLEARTNEELPEQIIGTCLLNKLDLAKAEPLMNM